MDVEELGLSHRARVVDLWARCGLTRPWNPPEADFERAVRGPTSTVLGVREGDHLLATVMTGDDGHRGWIYYLAVDPDRRRTGIGGRLVRAAERWLADRGVRKVELMVRASNHGVVELYDALGYGTEGVTVLSRWLVEPPA